jgi:hypothetical protein
MAMAVRRSFWAFCLGATLLPLDYPDKSDFLGRGRAPPKMSKPNPEF